jgi:pimeloyl-ACP methyl ester carboxylesterase
MTGRAVIQGAALEYRRIAATADESLPTLLFLHEGLGSVAQWRDFPDRVAAASGCPVFIYSRRGYGASDPVVEPRPVGFMHDEALEVLPAVRAHFGLDDVILMGHSDGASIAIIHAGARAGSVRGLVLEAPHVFVEPVCVESIARVHRTYATSGMAEGLARYHGSNTEAMFRSWADVWLRAEFLEWNIEEYLAPIEVPVLVIQGRDDEYGTVRQVQAVTSQVGGPARSLLLRNCGHSPHRDQPQAVLHASVGFIADVSS